jgi:hypothetical protein
MKESLLFSNISLYYEKKLFICFCSKDNFAGGRRITHTFLRGPVSQFCGSGSGILDPVLF